MANIKKIKVGNTTYDIKDEVARNQIAALDAQLNPYELSLRVSDTLKEYTGSPISFVFTASFKKNNVDQTPDSIVITCGSNESISPAMTLTVSRTDRGSYSGSVVATLNGLTYSKNNVASCKIMNALRIGFNPSSNSIAASAISSLDKKTLKNSVSGTYVVSNSSSNNYLWICCDDSLSISSVKSGGFDVPMHSFGSKNYLTVNGYKCYRSESKVNAGDNKSYVIA